VFSNYNLFLFSYHWFTNISPTMASREHHRYYFKTFRLYDKCLSMNICKLQPLRVQRLIKRSCRLR
jgi:hypothetical protein